MAAMEAAAGEEPAAGFVMGYDAEAQRILLR